MLFCEHHQPEGHFYQIQTKTTNNQSKFDHVKHLEHTKQSLINQKCRVRQINISQYQNLKGKLQSQKKQWIDPNFYPDDQRIGKQAKNKQIKWKRVTDIISNAVLYNKQRKHKIALSPMEDLYSSANLFVVLSAIESSQQIIDQIFQKQQISKTGIYKVRLSIQGEIQEVLIDDFIPVDQQDVPIFMKPKNNQIWMMLIEKARAKVYGSYQLMFQKANYPLIIIQQVLVAPAIQISLKNAEEKQKNWKLINSCLAQKRFAVCMSKRNQKQLNILPQHLYCLLQAKQIIGKDQQVIRVLKLKNVCGESVWKGRANHLHNSFWDSIQNQQSKFQLFKNVHDPGTFFILYEDLIQYFQFVTISKYQKFANYFTQQLSFSKKNAKTYELTVKQRGKMYLSLTQQNFKHAQNQDQKCQASLLIFKEKQENYIRTYQLVDFYNRPNQYGTVLVQTYLTPGVYIIYCKLYPTSQKFYPQISKLLFYSAVKFYVNPSQKQHKNLISRGFISHARNNKRQKYQNDLMWMSWKYFQQADYGYIAFGVFHKCQKQFQIVFNQSDFIQSGLFLKKPFKNIQGQQKLKVKAGQQILILVRKRINFKQKIVFPPKMDIQIANK